LRIKGKKDMGGREYIIEGIFALVGIVVKADTYHGAGSQVHKV
jgi:hypothetical protein